MIVLEFASGDSREERERTPLASLNGSNQKPGKFWVYEQIRRIPYYGIFQVDTGTLEMYRLVGGFYEVMVPSDQGHYAIDRLNVELGVWTDSYQNQEMRWLRWWDWQGNLLLTGQEEAHLERQEKEQAFEGKEQALEEKEQALEELDQERLKRQQLTEKLRSLTPEQLQLLGIEPDELV